jgi:LacI family transcriptional regulator
MSTEVPGRPTIWDVARMAGVSKSTVSRVLTNAASVAPATRERVNRAVSNLGYTRDYRGRALRTGRTATMGVIVPDLRNPVYSAIAAETQEQLFHAGYSLMLGAYGTDPSRQSNMIDNFISRGIDAIAITPIREDDEQFAMLASAQVPVVLLDREDPKGRFNAVTCAHGDAIAQALRHLEASGHEQAVVIDRPVTSFPGRDSREAVERFRLKSEMDIHHIPTTLISADEAYDAVMGAGPPRARSWAVIATSNLLMVGALRGLGVLGLKPGRDLSFIGTDDSPLSEVFEPPLTALQRDLALVGTSLAALLLVSTVEGDSGAEPRRIHVPMRLVRRASVR